MQLPEALSPGARAPQQEKPLQRPMSHHRGASCGHSQRKPAQSSDDPDRPEQMQRKAKSAHTRNGLLSRQSELSHVVTQSCKAGWKIQPLFWASGVQLCTEVLPLQKKGEQKWLSLSRVPFYTASITLTPKPTGTQRIKYMPKVL